MSSMPHASAGLAKETPSTSSNPVSGEAAQEQGESQPTKSSSNESGSAEAAAEKLYEERMEEEYAKREGGA